MNEKEMLIEITSLAYDISTTTKHDVFVSYSPHVNSVQLQIYLGGWKECKKSRFLYSYLDDRYNCEIKTIELINRLKEILENE